MLAKICCFSTEFCKCSFLGLSRNKNVKLAYICLVGLGFALSAIINSLTNDPSDELIADYGCSDATHFIECIRHKNYAIVFTAIAFMHLILFMCMFCKTEKVKIINEGLWWIKISIILLFLTLLSVFVDSSFFELMMNLSKWGSSSLYVFEVIVNIIEAIVYVELIYSLDNSINACIKQNQKLLAFKIALVVIALALDIFLSVIAYNYNLYTICLINTIFFIIFSVVALLRLIPNNSYLICLLAVLLMNLLGFNFCIAESEVLDNFCGYLQVALIWFLLLGMLCEGSNKLRTNKSSITEALALNTSKQEQDNRYVSSNKWTIYHLIMFVILLSIPVALSEGRDEMNDVLDGLPHLIGWSSAIILYGWSLLASKFFPEKDFSELENYFKEYELS